jgi:hypothetical protein
MRTAAPGASRGYPYAGIAYADPDAVTQIPNRVLMDTFGYHNELQRATTTSRCCELSCRAIFLGGRSSGTTPPGLLAFEIRAGHNMGIKSYRDVDRDMMLI